MIDAIPSRAGGLPENAPARPQVQPAFPSINVEPPARDDKTLTIDQQKKLETDLMALRDEQANRANPPAAPPPAAKKAAAKAATTTNPKQKSTPKQPPKAAKAGKKAPQNPLALQPTP
jgi:hypothetical protein